MRLAEVRRMVSGEKQRLQSVPVCRGVVSQSVGKKRDAGQDRAGVIRLRKRHRRSTVMQEKSGLGGLEVDELITVEQAGAGPRTRVSQ